MATPDRSKPNDPKKMFVTNSTSHTTDTHDEQAANHQPEVTPLKRVLVVDDDRVLRDTFNHVLEQWGYEVQLAADGIEGLQQVKRGQTDLVVTELRLPRLTGLEMLRRIRTISAGIPVIIITGYPSLTDAVEAMKLGALDFFTKPVELPQLRRMIEQGFSMRTEAFQNQPLLEEVYRKTEIERLNFHLNAKITELTKLHTVSEALNVFVDNNNLFQQIVKISAEVTGAQKVSLMLYDSENQRLVIRTARGLPRTIQRTTRIRLGEGVAGTVALKKRPIRTTRSSSHPLQRGPQPERYATVSFLSVPIFLGDELFGVLNLTDKKDESDFSRKDEELIMALAQKAAARIENNALYEGIYTNLVDTLRSLVTTIEAKDIYTRQHSLRVTDLGLNIADMLGCSQEEMEILSFGGILHDIGKIGIRDSVLLKPSRLTPDEYNLVKLHPVIGMRIVEPLGLIEEERDIIHHHHERLDGLGYPDALKGNQISLLARVMGVADAFDAMTSDRPYRVARSVEQSLQELMRGRGRQFDPDVVAAFLECVKHGKISLESRVPSDLLAAFLS